MVQQFAADIRQFLAGHTPPIVEFLPDWVNKTADEYWESKVKLKNNENNVVKVETNRTDVKDKRFISTGTINIVPVENRYQMSSHDINKKSIQHSLQSTDTTLVIPSECSHNHYDGISNTKVKKNYTTLEKQIAKNIKP